MARFQVFKKGDARIRGITDNAKAARGLARTLSKLEGAHFYVKRKTNEGTMAKKKTKKPKKKKGSARRSSARTGAARKTATKPKTRRRTGAARKTMTKPKTGHRSSASSGALRLAEDTSQAGRRRFRLAKRIGLKVA